MGDTREHSALSEDRTEPFSQSEIQARLQRSRMEGFDALHSAVPLDKLVVPTDDDIRILMRPLARDRSVREDGNVTLLALRSQAPEEDEPPHQVLAVRQTARDVSFTVHIPDPNHPDYRLVCILYYDPASDNQVIWNRSNVPFQLSRVSEEPEELRGARYDVNPNFSKPLPPGTWRITMGGADLLDFRLLERRPVRARAVSSASSSDSLNASGKRPLEGDDDGGSSSKRARASSPAEQADGVIMILPGKDSAKGKELVVASGHPLLDMESGNTLEVPRGGGLVGYTITKNKLIASTRLSSVFTAEYSEAPGRYVVAKVLKTPAPGAKGNDGALAAAVIRQAQMWLRELENQENLRHKNIVHLYGGDARFLSLYMESVDGKDLSAHDAWRHRDTDLFAGDRTDALRILRDTASGLHYLHSLRLAHNDIKPGNILYSRERGAVVCDMGLSSRGGASTSGGTPWYVPPEFIGLRQRGLPSDVWALGIVMLYVLGKMPLPDSRGVARHPQRLIWLIADVHNTRDPPLQDKAVRSMRSWLTEVNAVRGALDLHDKLERIVYGMLAPNPKERLTMKSIVAQLFDDSSSSSEEKTTAAPPLNST
ncbi:hypothetical protein VTJ83DRAFT_139 [Remersonia thermophila]|uniref:Protein kinase domain-containing protein n=1 Tax=Remersonia thermophila TaxID=72144 RepID=A0ABR4DK93_9PEZI